MLPRRAAVGLNRDVHAEDAVQVLQSVALVVRQVVLGDHAGARDPPAELHLRQGGVQYLSPDQIEEDVDPLGAVLLQSVLERGCRSVVEGGIEAELIDQVAHLFVGARHADHGQAWRAPTKRCATWSMSTASMPP